jgi:iron complex transport system substrate-binding protein
MTSRSISRRAFAIAGTGAFASFAVPSVRAQSTPVASEWSFTDDRDVTISLDTAPVSVAAMTYAAQSLYDFGYTVSAYFGPNATGDQSGEFKVIGDLDFSSIPYLGDFDSFDIEGLIAYETDLVVSYSFPVESGYDLWFVGTVEANIAPLAPTLGIAMFNESAAASIARFEELAALLGADIDTPEIQADRLRFETATTALQEATAAKPDLTVAVIRQSDNGVMVPNYDILGDLIYFKENGVQFIGNDPAHAPDAGSDWFSYSYEELDQLSADVILTFGDLTTIGTFQTLPAVQANQLGVWETVQRLSYRGFSESVEKLTTLIQNAEKVANLA